MGELLRIKNVYLFKIPVEDILIAKKNEWTNKVLNYFWVNT